MIEAVLAGPERSQLPVAQYIEGVAAAHNAGRLQLLADPRSGRPRRYLDKGLRIRSEGRNHHPGHRGRSKQRCKKSRQQEPRRARTFPLPALPSADYHSGAIDPSY